MNKISAKTLENLTKASDCAGFTVDDIRAAYKSAVSDENQLLVMVLLDEIERSVALNRRIKSILFACTPNP